MSDIEMTLQRERKRADQAEHAFREIYVKHLELGARFDAKRWKWLSGFMLGTLISTLMFISINVLVDRFRDRTQQQEAVERLLDAAKTAQEALR